MTDKTLWEEFNLAENNPDQGGGILYAMRYSADRIQAHREAVVVALHDIGIELQESDGLIKVIPKTPLSESDWRRAYALAEELSILNEATEYQDKWFGRVRNLGELRDGLVSTYLSLFDDRNLVDAYNLATVVVPQIVRDLKTSMVQGKPFSGRERQTIDDLFTFAVTRDNQLNRRSVFIG